MPLVREGSQIRAAEMRSQNSRVRFPTHNFWQRGEMVNARASIGCKRRSHYP